MTTPPPAATAISLLASPSAAGLHLQLDPETTLSAYHPCSRRHDRSSPRWWPTPTATALPLRNRPTSPLTLSPLLSLPPSPLLSPHLGAVHHPGASSAHLAPYDSRESAQSRRRRREVLEPYVDNPAASRDGDLAPRVSIGGRPTPAARSGDYAFSLPPMLAAPRPLVSPLVAYTDGDGPASPRPPKLFAPQDVAFLMHPHFSSLSLLLPLNSPRSAR